MKYEGVSFVVKSVLRYGSPEKFSETQKHLWKKVSEEIRKARLMEVFWICKAMTDANSV